LCIVQYLQLKEINSRLNRIEPKVPPSDGAATQYKVAESRSLSVNPKRGSPKTKSTTRESTLFGGKLYISRQKFKHEHLNIFPFERWFQPRTLLISNCNSSRKICVMFLGGHLQMPRLFYQLMII
jgi:hypothetical protein